jgi:hypothetical protein
VALTKIGKEGITGISNSSDATAITIDSSERVGIGITPDSTSNGKSLQINRSVINDDDGGSTHITQNGYYNSAWKYVENGTAEKISFVSGTIRFDNASSNSSGADASLTWAERMRIQSDGSVLINTTDDLIYPDSSGAGGIVFSYANYIQVMRDNGGLMWLNRISSDGDLINFYQDGSKQGDITVSGSTVSYNGFSGLHESSGIATDIPKGTVVSTIDELDVYSAKQGEAGEETDNPRAGQTRADHAKVKVSDTTGDKAVYGVVGSFNAQGKVNVVSVGVGSVRVTGACAKGDLLESNGDGTAKVQSDDIVRSKTIGKVTIGNSDTGVKLVSCVLYCG